MIIEMDFDSIILYIFYILFFIAAFVYAIYSTKKFYKDEILEVEKKQQSLIKSFVTIWVKPGRVLLDKGSGKITFYRDSLVIMHPRRRSRSSHEKRDSKTGYAKMVHSIFGQVSSTKQYKFAHVIKPEDIVEHNIEKRRISIKYRDENNSDYHIILTPSIFQKDKFIQVCNHFRAFV